MKQITITTDGACRFNVGPGGWAYSLREEKQLVEHAGGWPAFLAGSCA